MAFPFSKWLEVVASLMTVLCTDERHISQAADELIVFSIPRMYNAFAAVPKMPWTRGLDRAQKEAHGWELSKQMSVKGKWRLLT